MNSEKTHFFIQNLLNDVHILEKMIAKGHFQDSKPTLGAEQELCIVDDYGNVLPLNMEILKELNHPQFTTELAKFNLEINTSPKRIEQHCFSEMEQELIHLIERLKQNSKKAKFYIGGILPTLRHIDIDIDNITPIKRYFELVKNILKYRGEEYELRIQGEDELLMKHDSVFIEAATTSFQIHLEVAPENFAHFYNIAQLIAAPVLAISANSPFFLRKKLWHETRIALLRQSIDIMKTQNTIREATSRVTFGNRWLKNSILELFREDISLHRILMTPDINDNSYEDFENGKIPDLKALQLYNSTIYRWNRPVYGVLNNRPNLRIENRILPAGPTVVDQIANAVFWYGLMYGLAKEDISFDVKDENISFEECKNNFLKAARNGIFANILWIDGQYYEASQLVLKLIPIAQKGLNALNINMDDANKYLNIIAKRAQTKQNGSKWFLDSYKILKKQKFSNFDILSSIVLKSMEYQETNTPVSQWELLNKLVDMKKPLDKIIIEECMDRDLFTVRPNDILQIAADIIDWQKIRFLMVEDDDGKLIGIISSRNLLKYFNSYLHHREELPVLIEEIMVRNPITIDSNQKLSEALEVMKKYKIGCLPVLQNQKLVGIITEQTFLNVFSDIM
jgi:CBS domain-containing protein/gamma-glutamyl:cysteine ligase YbdK (ATP-grasp superfamily)